jgi:hypothetical protein
MVRTVVSRWLAGVLALAACAGVAHAGPNDPRVFFMQSPPTGLYLESNANKQIYTNTGTGGAPQKWQFVWTAEGAVFLRNEATGLYLDCDAHNQLVMNPYTGAASQQWSAIPYTGAAGKLAFQNRATGLYLDSNADRQVFVSPYSGAFSQRWLLTETQP